MHSQMFLSVNCTTYRSATNKVSLLLSKNPNKSSFVCPGMSNQNWLHKILSLSTLFKCLEPLICQREYFKINVTYKLLSVIFSWQCNCFYWHQHFEGFESRFLSRMRDWCCMAWLLSWNDITIQCNQNSYLIISKTLGQICEEYWKSESTLEEWFVCISIQLMSSFSPHIC